jgi:CheY-like chemotaxis protein
MAGIHKVLLIDDEDNIRTVAVLSLSKVGKWSVSAAASGAEGLELARRDRPDVVLVDVMMPNMDGIAVLGRLKEKPETSGIPVIFMTAKVQKREIERYMGLGAAGVIAKPFDPMTLPEEVRKIIEQRGGA